MNCFEFLRLKSFEQSWSEFFSFFFFFTPSSPVALPETDGRGSDSPHSLSGPRRNPRQLMAPHPILKGRAVLLVVWWWLSSFLK